ncbi:hypothetical protein GCM10011380_19150 [Sphingomonas metalli]|uniref:TonB C-terminal domain-containing protein n=1 Tax=Sphingomonas metalli TaxID=1779358 RepID=A0A916T459_9SPHN|nr:TonB family protein [Sphingomonas metalli]GGB29832.1 hypothetical protein GCM10011380_19150 [Sphingomonas metalli]
MAIATLASLLLLGASIPPPPPVDGERPLVAWLPGEVLCDGTAVQPVTMRRPLTTLGWSRMPVAESVTVRFRIDAEGRPLSIDTKSARNTYPSQDIAPSLAASRFASGAPRTGCEIRYRQAITPLADAPVADIVSYSLAPESGPLPEAGWARLSPAGSDCRRPPEILVRVSPEFRTLPGTPGVRDWVLLGHDIDARGRPREVQTLYSTGNGALNAAAGKAMRNWRFVAGRRTGCLNPFWRAALPLPAPDGPDPESLRPAGATCPVDSAWQRPPVLTYPSAFQRRGIEGWAIVAYDVAPWGEPGNIRVLASEPADTFGQQAEQVIRSARKPPSDRGAVGCIERVRFVMGPRDGMEGQDGVPPPSSAP